MACDDDLAWALFYYAGAAAAAGQTYIGAILATADGQWPTAVRSVTSSSPLLFLGGSTTTTSTAKHVRFWTGDGWL